MATERDIELLDDYLSNRLSESDRKAFELKLETDPELRQELHHQEGIVQGIREARAAELKAMLNNVPVGAIPGDQSFWAVKLVTIGGAAGLLATVLYFYAASEKADVRRLSESEQVVAEEPDYASDEGLTGKDSATLPDETPVPVIRTPPSTRPGSTPPDNAAVTVDAELQKERDLIAIVSRTFVTSSTEVIVERGDEQHTFHYAFRDKKLVLYGTFRKNEYQILEFITDKEHIFFLHYNQSYYLLDENTSVPTALVPIRDPALHKKLREFRTN